MSTGQRVVVVGTTGSGKTTLARQLAERLAFPHVELDALHWEADWQEAPDPVFRERTARALEGERWVVDGNYSQVRDLVWSRAETIVWLDYPLPVILRRLLVRTARRIVTREELWSGNREQLLNHFGKHSLFLWAVKTQPRHRREYPAFFQRPEYSHLRVVHLRSPEETARWLANVPKTVEPA
jgi:energy-coupling factor transporter ATP-binding protein EcfA2